MLRTHLCRYEHFSILSSSTSLCGSTHLPLLIVSLCKYLKRTLTPTLLIYKGIRCSTYNQPNSMLPSFIKAYELVTVSSVVRTGFEPV